MNAEQPDHTVRHDHRNDAADTKKMRSARDQAKPGDALIIIPVRDLVLFPDLIVPIAISRDSSISGVQAASNDDAKVGLLLQRDPEIDLIDTEGLHQVGTVATILRHVSMPDGSHYMVCQGEHRFRTIEYLPGFPFLVARVEHLRDSETATSEIEARVMQLKERTFEIMHLIPDAPTELADVVENITSAARLADFITGIVELKPQEKQDILETLDLRVRLDKILSLLVHHIEVLRISQDIHRETQNRFHDQQREILLREQLKTIQKQLGEWDSSASDVAALDELIAKARMPDEADAHARKELKRLNYMSQASGEYAAVLTYLDWLVALPWCNTTREQIDIAGARNILDDDHYGLQKIKRRILEYLSVRKLNPHGKSPILCFAGPPGVGKTSLGQSIAKATGRTFVRLSLGGVHDEAEIRGHRRTYVGALPGTIIQTLRKAGANNCVMMLDEVDKLAIGIQGSPSAALLEVLDPEQNITFRDHYLALPFDLSRILFICTANVLDTIPAPLRDRMEIIELPGYTEEEKARIARRYLVTRQLEANGLSSMQCSITDSALHAIIQHFTREAGVRNLEREIGAVLRHAAVHVAEGATSCMHVDAADLPAILGPPKFESEFAMHVSIPGVATGLAWTAAGGELLFIEASSAPGSGKLLLTGQLGEIMRESAQTALSLVKAHTADLKIERNLFEKTDIHVHVPAGATPKDGPSAGVAMFIALASLMTNRAVHSDRAMTGEISLRGLVMPVGGIKEKVLAALRAGIETILLPARNKKDLEEIPEEARGKIKFIWIDNVDDAMNAALMKS